MTEEGIVPVTIANNESLSAAVDLAGGRLFAIMMPADWTAADLTFQACHAGTTFHNVYNEDDQEVVVQAAEDRFIILNPARWLGVRKLKVRSGTAASAVTQGGAREINLVVVF